jgi:hypothetical protein
MSANGEPNGKTPRPGWGCLVTILVATLVLSQLPYSRYRRPIDPKAAFTTWLCIIVPCAIWIWWSFRRRSLDRREGRLGFSIRCVVWVVTAVIMTVVVADMRSGKISARQAIARATLAKSEPGYADRFAIFLDYTASREKLFPASPDDIEKCRQASEEADLRIAQRYHISVQQMNRIVESMITLGSPSNGPGYLDTSTMNLLFGALLILNMPLYWLISLLFFGEGRGIADLIEDAYSTSDSIWSYPFRARTLLAVSALAVFGELAMLFHFIW